MLLVSRGQISPKAKPVVKIFGEYINPNAESEPLMTNTLLPKRPEGLPLLTEATLEALSHEPLSANIILGGGVALKHYDDYRATQDIDAWWTTFRDPATLARVRASLEAVARHHGYIVEHRQFGGTDSLEFRPEGSPKKVFSFQISLRDVPLEEPLVSAWPPLWIETFRDNIGSKMNALVNRGAPRDLLDIYRVVHDGLISSPECWTLWEAKNENGDTKEAQGKVRTHLNRLEQRRPLESIVETTEREAAASLRQWYKETFLMSSAGSEEIV